MLPLLNFPIQPVLRVEVELIFVVWETTEASGNNVSSENFEPQTALVAWAFKGIISTRDIGTDLNTDTVFVVELLTGAVEMSFS